MLADISKNRTQIVCKLYYHTSAWNFTHYKSIKLLLFKWKTFNCINL